MFEVFESYIGEKANLNEEEIAAIRKVTILRRLRKKQYILQEGEVCRHNCFIAKGLLRAYRVDDVGNEHMLRFGIENWWMSDRESLNSGTLSKLNIDALEDSEVLLWTKENYDELLKTIPKLLEFTERLIQHSFDASQNRIFTSISYTAEEKYQDFIKSYPEIANRLPLHMIASYLGFSRETLSRIRNQTAHKS